MDLETFFAQKIDYLKIQNNFAIAVSGGIDSMVLLNLTAQYFHKNNQKNNPKAIILTVNHGLRKESQQETLFVYEESKKLGLTCHILNWTGSTPKSNIQFSARNIRYNLLCNWCHKNTIEFLILGHHQNDQIETLLMHLERGSGIDGLVGIREHSKINGIHIIRPLLQYTKQYLKNYALNKKINWIDDPSNQNIRYKRTLYRNILTVNNDEKLIYKRLCLTALHINKALEAILYYVRDAINHCLEFPDLGYINIKLNEFYKLPQEIAERLLLYSLMTMGQKKYKPRYEKFSNLFNQIWCKNYTKAQTFCNCKLIKNSNDTLSIIRELKSVEIKKVILTENCTDLNSIIWDNRFILNIKNCTKDAFTIEPINLNSHIPNTLKMLYREAVYILPALKTDNKVLAYPLQNITMNDYLGINQPIIQIKKVLVKQNIIDLTYNKLTNEEALL